MKQTTQLPAVVCHGREMMAPHSAEGGLCPSERMPADQAAASPAGSHPGLLHQSPRKLQSDSSGPHMAWVSRQQTLVTVL